MQRMKHTCSHLQSRDTGIKIYGFEIQILGGVFQLVKDLPGFSKHGLLSALVY